MLYQGQAYVPPNCPSLITGLAGDIENMEFLYDAHPCDDESGNPEIEIVVQFYKQDAPTDNNWSTVESYAEWPRESEAAQQAQIVMNGTQSQVMQRRVREIMCERVARCEGIKNGVCWAIGETALAEIHGLVIGELDSNL